MVDDISDDERCIVCRCWCSHNDGNDNGGNNAVGGIW